MISEQLLLDSTHNIEVDFSPQVFEFSDLLSAEEALEVS